MFFRKVFDFHVHLRQDSMQQMVTSSLSSYNACLVMPNLKPPVVNNEMALKYRESLLTTNPRVKYYMTLYLTSALTPNEIKECKRNGHVIAVKYYPKGLTTNSEHGASSDFSDFHPVLKEMEEQGIVLCLHGECPSNPQRNICILNAEEEFVNTALLFLHNKYPKLKIVLEHVTTKAGVEAVKRMGSNVAATITAHHLMLTVDDWAGKNHNFCKPVAKYPVDRDALREVVKEGNPKFFLGSDSAPHLKETKECRNGCAGVYTSHYLIPYVLTIFDRLG
jgi:dihydroorotase